MTAYVLRRLAQMVPVLFLISLFVFFMVRLVPGDPAAIMLGPRATDEAVAEIRASLRLDQPIWVQYGVFLRNAAEGDLGDSIRRREPVRDVLADRLRPTLFLVAYAAVLSVAISLPLAALAAVNRGRWIDGLVRGFVLLSLAMPAYWIGMMLLQQFAVRWQVFPVAGWGETFPEHLHALFLPALAMALAIASILIRGLRSALIETMDADHVRTARAKGLPGRRVFAWHVLRNSSLSTVTLLGVNLAFLVGGTTVIETIFSVPGIGQLIVRSIFDRDYPVVQGVTLLFGVLVMAINLATDLGYALLDPRLRLS
ncbi:MAG TPA: ABC transporter permease [Thermomicrobiales bacterium]|jgi:peptide/nickel transport system permease protein|nr:ABC transporter permease [Thermomicrobiales bacterium]